MSQSEAFPTVCSAPEQLSHLSGACGPVSLWLVLTRHGIRAEPREILLRCKYTDEFGSFAVCLADALQYFGLRVRFHTDPDSSPHADEQEAYGRIATLPATSIPKLVKEASAGASVIVSYLARGGEGHFSPLVGVKANKVLLPYSAEGSMLRSEFGKRWRASGILRQAVIAT
jgi:hypothetical protein